jgi:YXWGXW repeat-containing protein
MHIRSIRSLLITLAIVASSLASFAQIGISVRFGPPAIPVYEQPLCPGDGYLWTPGYWAYGDDDGYFWVPGTWVLAPEPGFLWTPGYWGWGGDAFIFHEGFWGPTIGFYGGINYGFGYFGNGFEGGRWEGDHFFYNRAVMNVNVTNIHNVYNTTVVNRMDGNRVSYNGGEGGVSARPTPQEEAAANGRHIGPIAAQQQHVQMARSNPELRASTNQGRPRIAATARATDFKEGAMPAKEAGAPYHAPAGNAEGARSGNNVPRPPNNATHASELPEHHPATPPSTGNAKTDQKYQQQQTKLAAKQNQQHQKLQKQQDQEHQRLTQQNANDAKKQQVEQKHTQQTQQMEQKHTQQQQHLQQKQAPPERGKR